MAVPYLHRVHEVLVEMVDVLDHRPVRHRADSDLVEGREVLDRKRRKDK